MVDEQKLRELAESATPLATELYGDRYFQGDYSKAELTKEQDDFYSAAHPAAILALLDELQTLRSERTEWRVTAENAEPDAARYRWLTFDHPKQDTRVALYAITSSLPFRGKGNTDAAIDAAMKGES